MNKSRGFASIGLNYPKNNINVGSVLRACSCFDVNMLAVTGQRYKHRSADTTKRWKHMPFLQVKNLKDVIPYRSVPVAVEIIEKSKSLISYVHPENAFYIFGPEDGSLGKEILSWCRDVVSIPSLFCLNLAATVNVVLYDRMTKQRR